MFWTAIRDWKMVRVNVGEVLKFCKKLGMRHRSGQVFSGQ